MLAPHDSAVLTHRSSTSPCLVGYRAPRSCMVVMSTAARAPTMLATHGRRKDHRQMWLPLHPQAVGHQCWSCPSTGSSRTCEGASREGSGAGPPRGTAVVGHGAGAGPRVLRHVGRALVGCHWHVSYSARSTLPINWTGSSSAIRDWNSASHAWIHAWPRTHVRCYREGDRGR